MTNQPTVTLDDGNQGHTVELLKPLRILKGKRAVFEANWKGEKVLIKLFIKERYWSKEKRGLGFLSKYELTSPKILYSGLTAQSKNLRQYGVMTNQQLYILILVFYKNALDL